MNFTGKTALVTGASVGIGRACALELAEFGASLVLLDVNFEKLSAVKEEILSYTDKVLIYQCDISDESRVFEVVSDAISQFGKIDILVNNAALWRSFTTFLDTPTEEWKRYFDVNVFGTTYVTKAVLPSMIEQKYGRIINVASVAGSNGNRDMAHYSATKAAVIAFTKSLAKQMADKGITVNSVSPGTVSPSNNDDVNHYIPSATCYMGRTGTGRENAELICFLASYKAPYINGQDIKIDGCRKIL